MRRSNTDFTLHCAPPTMKTLTTEEIQRLTPAQQDTLASLELNRFQTRQQLLKRARSYFGRVSLVRDFIFVIAGLSALELINAFHHLLKGEPVFSIASITSISLLALAVLVAVHIIGINRRLDAVLKLLDEDIQKADPGGV